MAGLLDYINAGGNKLLQALEAIGTPNTVADPAMLEMMTPEQRQMADRYARSAGIAAMQEAAMQNVPWYAMGAARDVKAQDAYQSYLQNATTTVEELRKRREGEGRRKSVSELVARIANPEDPMSKEYTPEQIELLRALPPDQAAELMSKRAFPKESGINIATAGTVQGGRFKLANGNIGAMIQTGDPSNPVRIVDTGQRYISEDPSMIRGLEGLIANPALIQAASDLKKGESTGTGTGTANVEALKTLPATISQTRRHQASLRTLRDQVLSTPTGALTGRVLTFFNSDFQALQASILNEGLMNIAALAQAGVRLNPISVDELFLLMSTSPKITNNPEANRRILDERIEKLEAIVADAEAQLQFLDMGGDITQYRPRGYQRPTPAPNSPPPGPGQPVPAPAPMNIPPPPAGGAGAVSTIPIIKPQGR